jgi:hypothetical protein
MQGLDALCDALTKSKTLESLCIANTGIGGYRHQGADGEMHIVPIPAAPRVLATALAFKDATLNSLDISSNNLGTQGSKLISEGLSQNRYKGFVLPQWG